MEETIYRKAEEELRNESMSFELPEYLQIPDVGLYLDQVTKYINRYLRFLSGVPLTGSMISNYVKQGIIRNPVKKQYDRDQIALLMFVAVAKTILSLEDIKTIIHTGLPDDPSSKYSLFLSVMRNSMEKIFSGIENGFAPADLTGHVLYTALEKIHIAMLISKAGNAEKAKEK